MSAEHGESALLVFLSLASATGQRTILAMAPNKSKIHYAKPRTRAMNQEFSRLTRNIKIFSLLFAIYFLTSVVRHGFSPATSVSLSGLFFFLYLLKDLQDLKRAVVNRLRRYANVSQALEQKDADETQGSDASRNTPNTYVDSPPMHDCSRLLGERVFIRDAHQSKESSANQDKANISLIKDASLVPLNSIQSPSLRHEHIVDESNHSYIATVTHGNSLVIDAIYTKLLDLLPGDEFYLEPEMHSLRIKILDPANGFPESDELITSIDSGNLLPIPSAAVKLVNAMPGFSFGIKLGRDSIKLERMMFDHDLHMVNRLARALESGVHIFSLLFVNPALQEAGYLVDNHQCYLFLEKVLVSDKMLPGFLYVNMDGVFSNCFDESSLSHIFSWDSLTDIHWSSPEKSAIDLVCPEGSLTISLPENYQEPSQLTLLMAFYHGTWKKIIAAFSNQPFIEWSQVRAMGIQDHRISSEEALESTLSDIGF